MKGWKLAAICKCSFSDTWTAKRMRTAFSAHEKGLNVTSVEISPKAVEVMRRRGVHHPIVGDVFDS